MYAGDRAGMKFTLDDGMKIIASGRISVYERDGKYQLYVKSVQRDGAGALYERYLALKTELEEMGMFDASYKKPLPKYALNIGVVTAQTGAVIHDIQNVAYRRNPYVQIYLYPAKVQGEGASETICEGIRTLDAMNPDVIIIGRGGGSIEDLWAFNEECVARAIFECNTPIISAVGHETDFTIADSLLICVRPRHQLQRNWLYLTMRSGVNGSGSMKIRSTERCLRKYAHIETGLLHLIWSLETAHLSAGCLIISSILIRSGYVLTTVWTE